MNTPTPTSALECAEELIALAKKATPGPWHHRQATFTPPYPHEEEEYDYIADVPDQTQHKKVIIQRGCLYGGRPDYAFIAAANPEAVTMLARAYKALRAQVAEHDLAWKLLCAKLDADCIADVIAAVDKYKALRARTQWQPIETAPKDGTPVDLWGAERARYENERITDCRFQDGVWKHHRTIYDAEPASGDDMAQVYNATHWMHLPAPHRLTSAAPEALAAAPRKRRQGAVSDSGQRRRADDLDAPEVLEIDPDFKDVAAFRPVEPVPEADYVGNTWGDTKQDESVEPAPARVTVDTWNSAVRMCLREIEEGLPEGTTKGALLGKLIVLLKPASLTGRAK